MSGWGKCIGSRILCDCTVYRYTVIELRPEDRNSCKPSRPVLKSRETRCMVAGCCVIHISQHSTALTLPARLSDRSKNTYERRPNRILKTFVVAGKNVTRLTCLMANVRSSKQVCVDPPRITALTLPARCCAVAPVADMDRRDRRTDGWTDERTPDRYI